MNPLLASGLELMLIGMGTVFAFLMLLVLITGLMSTLINKYAPEVSHRTLVDHAEIIDDELRQAIIEAVRLHRQRRGMN
jgi:oxaloacetate decarboxylase gamma subunit